MRYLTKSEKYVIIKVSQIKIEKGEIIMKVNNKKIRFLNPLKEMLDIQGKKYTIAVLATIVASIPMIVLGVYADLHWLAAILGVAVLVAIAMMFWHFGVEVSTLDEEEN